MPFDLAETKRKARQALHGLAGVRALYTGPEDGAEPVGLFVRWHAKHAVPMGDLDNQGYAELMAGIDRLVFNESNLAAPVQDDGTTATAVTLRRNGTVEFPQYSAAFTLDQRDPSDGPENVYWTVTRD